MSERWDRFVARKLAEEGAPPAEVRHRAPTVEDVRAWPFWFIVGPGSEVARQTQCAHGYNLTDSCPCCE